MGSRSFASENGRQRGSPTSLRQSPPRSSFEYPCRVPAFPVLENAQLLLRISCPAGVGSIVRVHELRIARRMPHGLIDRSVAVVTLLVMAEGTPPLLDDFDEIVGIADQGPQRGDNRAYS